MGRTNVSPTTFGPGALDLDHQTRDAGRRPRRGQILATPVREPQARTGAAGPYESRRPVREQQARTRAAGPYESSRPVREQQARTRAAGMMPTGRHRYRPILGQILRGKGPKVDVKARRTSVRRDQLQIRRPSVDDLGTGPTRLPRVTITRRQHGWPIRGSESPTDESSGRGEVLAETAQVFRFWLTYRRPPRGGDPRGRT